MMSLSPVNARRCVGKCMAKAITVAGGELMAKIQDLDRKVHIGAIADAWRMRGKSHGVGLVKTRGNGRAPLGHCAVTVRLLSPQGSRPNPAAHGVQPSQSHNGYVGNALLVLSLCWCRSLVARIATA
jgi:hypothetical protein